MQSTPQPDQHCFLSCVLFEHFHNFPGEWSGVKIKDHLSPTEAETELGNNLSWATLRFIGS